MGQGESTSHKSMLSMVSGGPSWYVPLIKLEYHYTANLGFWTVITEAPHWEALIPLKHSSGPQVTCPKTISYCFFLITTSKSLHSLILLITVFLCSKSSENCWPLFPSSSIGNYHLNLLFFIRFLFSNHRSQSLALWSCIGFPLLHMPWIAWCRGKWFQETNAIQVQWLIDALLALLESFWYFLKI